jgi:hypothetical protein
MKNKLQELQSTLERDEETLQSLGGEVVINGVSIPTPTTAVLSLFEIIESPFITGVDSINDIRLIDINEALYILKFREVAAKHLYRDILHEKLNYQYNSEFKQQVFEFSESLGLFDIAETSIEIQNYLSVCFNAQKMIPSDNNNKTTVKKKDSMTQNG